MCPYLSNGSCELKEDEQAVPDSMKVYYCDNKQFPNAYENCPTYQKRKSSS